MYKKKILINIPQNTVIFKISSLNINLNDAIDRTDHIKMIVNYVFSEINDVDLDIVCLQGVNDKKLLKILINGIYKLSRKNKKPVNIIPNVNFDYTNSVDSSIIATYSVTEETDNILTSNVIISRYPIISSKITLFDDNQGKSIITANISINDYIISIFNTALTKDSLGISNNSIRIKEIDILKKVIDDNTLEMKKINSIINKYHNKYIIKDINIIACLFNIDETRNSTVNVELIKYFKRLNGIDMFRILDDTTSENYYTTTKNVRDNYLLLVKDIVLLTSNKQIINDIFSEQNTGIIMSYVVESFDTNDNHPIESLLLLNIPDKKKEKE